MSAKTVGKNIKDNLEEIDLGLQKLYDVLYQEKKEHLKHFMNTVEEFRKKLTDESNGYIALEEHVQSVTKEAINKFHQQEPTITFKIDFRKLLEPEICYMKIYVFYNKICTMFNLS